MSAITRSLIVLTIILGLLLALPVAAQQEPEVVIAIGEVSFSTDGEISVEGYIIAPAGVVPASLSDGDEVTVTGYLLADGETIQALSIEINSEEEVAGTTEELENEAAEESEEEEADVERGIFCTEAEVGEAGLMHPAGLMLANEFEADYDDVMAVFCEDSYGFGEIMLAQMLAEATGEDAQSFLDALDSGHNWGEIILDNEINPGEIFSGRILGQPEWAQPEWITTGRPDNIPGGRPDDIPGGQPDDIPGGRPDDAPDGKPSGVGGRP